MNRIYTIVTLFFAFALSHAISAQTYPVRWTDLIGVSNANEILTKTAASGSWNNAGATSSNYLAPNTNGSIEFSFSAAQQQVLLGLISNSFSNVGVDVFDYSLGIGTGGTIFIHEGASVFFSFGTYMTTDVFRISREGSQVKYYKNGTVIRTVTANAALPLWAKAVLLDNGQTTSPVTASFDAQLIITPTITGTVTGGSTGSIVLNVAGGKTPYTYSWAGGGSGSSLSGLPKTTKTVTVTDADGRSITKSFEVGYKTGFRPPVGVNESNGSLTRTAAGNAWNAGADASNSTSNPAWIEFVVRDYNSVYEIGIGSGIDYASNSFRNAIMLNINGTFSVIEGDNTYPMTAFRAGDVFRIERTSTQIVYSRNGISFKTSTLPSNSLVVPKVSVYQGTSPQITCSVDAHVNAAADVRGTGVANGTGSVTVSAYGGIAPYTYSWAAGAGTGSTLTNKSRGSYTVTITDSEGRTVNRTYSIGYNQIYSDLYNASESDGIITKTSSGFNGGGVTSNILPATGTQGWFEFVTPAGTPTSFIVGIFQGENAWTTADVQTGIYQAASSNAPQVYSIDPTSGQVALGTSEPGDVLRIERSNGNVTFSKNGTVLKTVTLGSADWRVKVSVVSGSGPRVTSSFDAQPIILADVDGSPANSNKTSVNASVKGGKAPYNFSWNTGQTSSVISNKPRGIYTLTVTDSEGRTASRTYNTGYRNNWYKQVNVSPGGTSNGLMKSNGTTAWNASALGSGLIPAGTTSGFLEFVTKDVNSTYAVGFSYQDNSLDPGASAIYFGLIVNANGSLAATEISTTIPVGRWQPGDVFRIERSNNSIIYYRNGVGLRTVTAANIVELKPRVLIYQGIAPPVISSDIPKLTLLGNVTGTEKRDSVGSISLTPMGGTGAYTYLWASEYGAMTETVSHIENKRRGRYTVTVTDTTGTSIQRSYYIGYKQHYTWLWGVVENAGDNGLTRTAAGTGWGQGANSYNVLPANTDGFLEWVVKDDGAYYMAGFGAKPSGTDFSDFRNGFSINGGSARSGIYEGTNSILVASAQPGDVFRISREGSNVIYYRNGTSMRTIASNATLDFYFKVVVNSGGSPAIVSSFDTSPVILPTIGGTGVADNAVNITTTVEGGFGPYTYLWSSGETTPSLVNKPRGAYSLTVKDASGRTTQRTYEVKYKSYLVDSKNLSPKSGYPEFYSATTTVAGANSSNIIPSGTTGNNWIEWVHQNNMNNYQVGFALNDYNFSALDFLYSLSFTNMGVVNYYETATSAFIANSQAGDVYRLARENNNIVYYKNGVAIRTVAISGDFELRPKFFVSSGTVPAIIVSVDSQILPVATVVGTANSAATGSISVNPVGGSGVYTYSWLPASGTANTISNKGRNSYTVTVTDNEGRSASRTYAIGYRPFFQNTTNVTLTANALTKVNSTNYDGGAVSSGYLLPNEPGWVEMVVPPFTAATTYRSGFSLADGGYANTGFRNALQMDGSKSILAIEGSTGAAFGNILPGDVLRIEREGSNITYKRNGATKRTVATDPSLELHWKAAIATGTVPMFNTSFDSRVVVSPVVTGTSMGNAGGGISLSATGGEPGYTYIWSPNVSSNETASSLSKGAYLVVVKDASNRQTSVTFNIDAKPSWTGVTGVNLNGQSLSKTAAAGWNAGALTAASLDANKSGSVEFAIVDNTSSFIIGFTTTVNSFLNTSFTNAIFVDPSTSSIYAAEGSTNTYLSSYQVGDILKIERSGGSMLYKRNGATKKITSVSQGSVLRVKAAINTGSAPGITSSFEIDDFAISVKNLAFQYKYDKNQRLIKKKLPGADWVYMVYDKRDRLVLTQDGAMRTSNQWQFFKYDDLDRTVSSGMIKTATPASQEDKQAEVDLFYSGTSPVFGESRGDVVHGYTNNTYPSVVDTSKYWTVNYYDDYSWIANTGAYSDSLLFSPNEFPASDFPDVVEPAAMVQVPGLLTGTKAKVLDGGPMYLTAVTYYDAKGRVIQTVEDNYKLGTDRVTSILDFTGRVIRTKTKHIARDITWRDKKSFSDVGRLVYNSSPSPGFRYSSANGTEVLPAGQDGWAEIMVSDDKRGGWRLGFGASNSDDIDYAVSQNNSLMLVWTGSTSTTIPGVTAKSGDFIKIRRVGNTIRIYKNNVEITATQARINNVNTGQMLVRLQLYFNPAFASAVRSSVSTTEHSIWRRFDYDLGGRLVNTWHKFDKGPEVLLAQSKYDVLGRLKDKNLHSADNGATSRQSIDYRYDIHGWLTSINGSEMVQDGRNSDLPGQDEDLFGLDLLYNDTIAGINDNSGMYNGSISAMKWGTKRATVNQSAYKFSYDSLSRIKGASFRQKTSDWSASSNYSESGYKYDRNGNITNLTRNGKNGSAIDVLTYTYGSGSEKLNSLLKVADSAPAASKGEGFIDGSNTDFDYSYDANGNLVADKNKLIGNISYIYPLNLPSSVTKGTTTNKGTLNIIYDATGRKLNESVAYDVRSGFFGTRRNTDYSGEFQYEDGLLQSVQHEEGRIAVATRERIAFHDGSTLAGITAASSVVTVDPVSLHDGRSYLKVIENANSTGPGINLATDIAVQAGETYVLRVKGYTATPTIVTPLLKAAVTQGGQTVDITGNLVAIPVTADGDSWSEQAFRIADNMEEGSLTVGVYNPSSSAYQAIFYIDEFELVRVSSIDPEYQYDLKDHLGNVRATFGTRTKDVVRATYELDSAVKDKANFRRYELAKRVKSHLFDHTKNDNPVDTIGYAQRLNGSLNEKIGLAKSLAVMPGDRVKADVYAKYLSADENNWSDALGQLVNFLKFPATAPAYTIIDGGGYGSSGATSLGITPIGHGGDPNNGAPKAYLNFIFINKVYDPASLRVAFAPITTAAEEDGSDKPHEHLTLDEAITEEGYVYVYISNDNPQERDVYFDDFNVEHIKSPIIQSQDFYPFGLTYNSYSREDALNSKWKFQSQQHLDALDLNWDSFKWRNHQPEIGRFFNLDPIAEKYYYNSPYAFSENKVVAHIELEGLESNRAPKPTANMYQSQAVQNYRNIVRRDIVKTSFEYNDLEFEYMREMIAMNSRAGLITAKTLDFFDNWNEMSQMRQKNFALRVTRNETENANVFGDVKTESTSYSFSGPGADELRAIQKTYTDKVNSLFDKQFAAYATKTLGKDFNSLNAEEQSKFRVENLDVAGVIRFGIENKIGPSPFQQVINSVGQMIQQGGVKKEVKRHRQPMVGPR